MPPPSPIDLRSPVLVGVGVASDDAEPVELMARALLGAAADAGSTRILGAIDRMAVPQGNWAYPDPARLVADRVGARECRTHLVELGIPQQSLINQAMRAILEGRSQVAVIIGGEAKRRSQQAERSGRTVEETPQPGVRPDVVEQRPGPSWSPSRWPPACGTLSSSTP